MRFVEAARAYCAWVRDPSLEDPPTAETAAVLVAELVAAACWLGWAEGCPAPDTESSTDYPAARARFANFPVGHYAEIFDNLVVPPEEPVVGDGVDDLADIYCDLQVGLVLFDAGDKVAAFDHWQFWFTGHWGEHATSLLRALWRHLAREVTG